MNGGKTLERAGTTSRPGQFYHVETDDRFPYWIYSGQQDSGTAGAATRSDYGSLSFRDWHPVGGEERGWDVPDPEDPLIVYGSGLGGTITRYDGRTGEVRNVSPAVESSVRTPSDPWDVSLGVGVSDRHRRSRPRTSDVHRRAVPAALARSRRDAGRRRAPT